MASFIDKKGKNHHIPLSDIVTNRIGMVPKKQTGLTNRLVRNLFIAYFRTFYTQVAKKYMGITQFYGLSVRNFKQ